MIGSCSGQAPAREVVLYTSIDQPFAEPVLARYQEESGVKVKAVYDLEASKTTGLVNRLIAEKDRPQADVYWNNEIIQSIHLKEAGILKDYFSPERESLPMAYMDHEGYWTGHTARARVILLNTNKFDNNSEIDSLQDLLDEEFPAAEIGIAYPMFGTTATHAAALYAFLGEDAGRDYFQKLADRGIKVVDGNSVIRDMVASGQLAFGLTDTDDACGAVERGDPVAIVLPDQAGFGTLVIPSTVTFIKGAPHEEEGRRLIDYLLSSRVEQQLLEMQYSHIPLHAGMRPNPDCPLPGEIKSMAVDFEEVYIHLGRVQSDLRNMFIR